MFRPLFAVSAAKEWPNRYRPAGWCTQEPTQELIVERKANPDRPPCCPSPEKDRVGKDSAFLLENATKEEGGYHFYVPRKPRTILGKISRCQDVASFSRPASSRRATLWITPFTAGFLFWPPRKCRMQSLYCMPTGMLPEVDGLTIIRTYSHSRSNTHLTKLPSVSMASRRAPTTISSSHLRSCRHAAVKRSFATADGERIVRERTCGRPCDDERKVTRATRHVAAASNNSSCCFRASRGNFSTSSCRIRVRLRDVITV